ncbi:MAG: helicase, partial [Candidatus Parabeggiatoa sp. nov. 3]
AWLEKQDVKTTHWEELKPTSPFYLFIPQDVTLREEYEQYWKVTDMMPLHGVGMTTARDEFVIDHDKDALLTRIMAFRNAALSDDELHDKFNIRKKKGWDIRKAWQMLQNIEEKEFEKYLTEVLYRPFEKRYIYYHDAVVWRTVKKIMQHMLAGENLGLITRRQMLPSQPCTYFYTSNNLISDGVIRSDNRGGESLFPLYIYPTTDLLNSSSTKRKPNFAPNFIKDIATGLKLQFIDDGTGDLSTTFGPEDIFHYLYAVFHSPIYRERYAGFLKIDFPRLPLTRDKTLFQQLAKLGSRLVTIHLMEADIESESCYPIEGDNLVEKITYKNEKVYINKTQYFDHVTEAVWQCHIGGYQVCQKWLKDRKGRQLSYDDCTHYLYILAALEQTLDLMAKIDQTIPEFPLP